MSLIQDPKDVKDRAAALRSLARIVDHVTDTDLIKTAELLEACASDIAYLLQGNLIGCQCARKQGLRGVTVITYSESCVHHGVLAAELQEAKKQHDAMRTALQAPYRAQFMAAILSRGVSAEGARGLADQAVAALLGPSADEGLHQTLSTPSAP